MIGTSTAAVISATLVQKRFRLCALDCSFSEISVMVCESGLLGSVCVCVAMMDFSRQMTVTKVMADTAN